eukprot:NODE_384_length_9596_cov_0.282510.p1 type:complete len:539 gc:universal NODE_384_length_9596_cov_0.282510:4272-2656(-)
MLIRVRTANGQFNLTVSSDDINELASLLNKELHYSEFHLSSDPVGKCPVANLQHGALVYLHSNDKPAVSLKANINKSNPSMKSLDEKARELDSLDLSLWSKSGEIQQSINSMCRHGDLGKCSYCTPVSPFDKSYLDTHNIKHLSFHAYLKKLKLEKPDFLIDLLEDQSIKTSSVDSKSATVSSLSSTISLTRQSFRMVDHIEFETHDIVDKFLKSWRSTGHQRFGWLIGHYSEYDQVPLGIKAVVSAIYEPAQHGFVDGALCYYLPSITSGDESDNSKLEFVQLQMVLTELNLQIVGIILTDLKDAGNAQVVHKRHLDSYFLSAQECQLAGTLQNVFPYKTPFSASGVFGSRLVTCILSGNKQGGVEIEAYQTSNTCMSLCKSELIKPTFNPGYMMLHNRIKEASLPTLQYRYIDKYGNAVSSVADPTFPVEYLITTTSHGFPLVNNPTFKSSKYFNIENRISEPQEPLQLREYFNAETLFYDLSNIHVIMYIIKMGIIDDECTRMICKIARDPQHENGMKLLNMPGWQTLEMLIQEY